MWPLFYLSWIFALTESRDTLTALAMGLCLVGGMGGWFGVSYSHSSKHICSPGCISNTCPVHHPKSCRAQCSLPCPQGASHHHHRCAGLPSVQLLNEEPSPACPDPLSLLYHLAVMCCCSSSLPPLFSGPSGPSPVQARGTCRVL